MTKYELKQCQYSCHPTMTNHIGFICQKCMNGASITTTNFMQLGEYHCLVCHKDSSTMEGHICLALTNANPTPCTEKCKKWFKSGCDHIMEETGRYERECKFCHLTELTAKNGTQP